MPITYTPSRTYVRMERPALRIDPLTGDHVNLIRYPRSLPVPARRR